MVTADGTDAFVLGKRKQRRARRCDRRCDRDHVRESLREQIRKMSRHLVRSRQIPKTPCLICGSKENPTIYHIEPMRPDRFVFLCQTCYNRAHRPLYRTISILLPFGQFSVRPEAVLPREEVPCG